MNIKYLKDAGIFYSKKKPGDSSMSTDMQKVKKSLLKWQEDADR
jgi:hypothetical protein